MTADKIEAIIQRGILAPSADNLQPWKFRVAEDRIDVFLDPRYVTSFCDTGLLVPYLSVGAVIENMRIAAADTGFQQTVSYFPSPSDPLWVATLRFSLGAFTIAEHSRDPILANRVTNRKFFETGRQVPPALLTSLRQIVEKEKGFRLIAIPKSEPDYKPLSAMIGEADQIRFENQRLHRELIQILRLTPSQVQGSNDGLDVRSLESGPGAGILFRLISSWQGLCRMNALGLSRFFNLYARLQMRSSQGAGLLVAPSQRASDYVLGGELMQRIWIEMTRNGVAIQPMEALPIFIINLQLSRSNDLSLVHRQKIQKLTQEFFRIFGINDENGLILLFRYGYAKPVSARSRRRPLVSFVNHVAAVS